MRKRTRLHAFAVISVLASGLAAQAQDPAAAPVEPIKVAVHSSRWDYPREVTPPPGHTVHIVEKGDTLWDLGTKYLGNPFAWPQIWELNKWVKDPHWIYPGDPLIVDGSRSSVPRGREEEAAPQEVSNLRPDLRRGLKPTLDEYAYSFQDFIQMPFITAEGATKYFRNTGAFLIQGHQDQTRGIHSDGDIIYLKGGSDQGVKVGDRLVVTKVATKGFYHPEDTTHRHNMGDVLQQEGVIRVTHVDADASVAVIEHALDGIYEGAYGVPFSEPANIVTNLRKDIASPVPLKDPLATVIYLREDRPVAAGGDMVIIDQGLAKGLKVGDVLLLARRRPLDSSASTGNLRKDEALPSTTYYLGQLIVVRAEQETATCRLLRSREEVFVGDVVTR